VWIIRFGTRYITSFYGTRKEAEERAEYLKTLLKDDYQMDSKEEPYVIV